MRQTQARITAVSGPDSGFIDIGNGMPVKQKPVTQVCSCLSKWPTCQVPHCFTADMHQKTCLRAGWLHQTFQELSYKGWLAIQRAMKNCLRAANHACHVIYVSDRRPSMRCNAAIPSQEAVSLCTALRGNSQLTELYASNHEMSAQTAAVVSDLLASTSTLKMLCLGDAAFGDAGLAALAPGLQANQSLTRLDLENKVRGVHQLSRYMSTTTCVHQHSYATCLTRTRILGSLLVAVVQFDCAVVCRCAL